MSMNERLQELMNIKRMDKNSGEESNYVRNLYKLIIENFQPWYTVAEIGTYEAVSTELFAITCRNVITIDPYEEGDNFIQETKEQLINADRLATARLSRYDNVIRFKMTSEEAAKKINYKIDAVYIDGDHRPEMVRLDIETWIKKIKPNGYISGHDFGTAEVGDMVREILGEPDKIYEDGSWIFKCTKI